MGDPYRDVPSGREPHEADASSVDTELVGSGTNEFHRCFGVSGGKWCDAQHVVEHRPEVNGRLPDHLGVSGVGARDEAVDEHEGGDAALGESFGDLQPLALDRQDVIATAWRNDNRRTVARSGCGEHRNQRRRDDVGDHLGVEQLAEVPLLDVGPGLTSGRGSVEQLDRFHVAKSAVPASPAGYS